MNPVEIASTAVEEHQACQKIGELAAALTFVHALRPKTVVEIGTLAGGTLWAWAQVAADDATLIGVDIEPKDHDVGRASQTVLSVTGPSSKPSTVATVHQLLNGRPIEFLFLDGDHREEAVLEDFNNYSARMVGFHDIVHPVDVVWHKLRGSNGIEILEGPDRDDGWGPWGGIGLLGAL